MKINPILPKTLSRISFKSDNEDEYVYVPLVWNESDSYQCSYKDKKSDKSQESPKEKTKPKFKLKKWATTITSTVGAATIIPAGVENAVKTVDGTLKKIENTLEESKNSINNTLDSINDIKEHARQVFNLHPKQTESKQMNDDNHIDLLPQDNFTKEDKFESFEDKYIDFTDDLTEDSENNLEDSDNLNEMDF